MRYSKETSSTKTDFTGGIADLYAEGAESSISNLTNSIAKADNFMMTNAPISDKASLVSGTSWDPNISTLVRLKVYDDQATAEDATADNIYVERVVAKATVKVSNDTENDYTLNVTNDAYPNAVVDFTNWKLQNTNKKTYLVRNVGTGKQAVWKQWIGYYNTSATKTVNRFVGETSDPYRTYWGIDPNYKTVEGTNLGNNFNIWTATNTDAEIGWNDVANNKTTNPDAEYCLENTCEANAMNKNQLTSVLLKATFYVNGKPSAGDDAESFFTVNNISEIYTKDDMLQALTVCLANSETEGVPLAENESLQLKSAESGKNITSSTDLKAVFEVKTANGVSELSDDQANAILTSYNPIKYFKDGVTFYYTSLIEHFGETYTPVAESSTGSYTYNDNDHLGYFGVLRNNWYELNITEVSGPGEPEIPNIPEDPGHTEYYFVKVAVNVLSWARRAQSVEL